MSCSVCLEQNSELFKDKLCNCQFCYWCALEWIEEKINQKQSINQFPCLNHKCKQIITLDHFFSTIKRGEVEQKYQAIMFKNYLQQTADIRPCPNAKCNSYAFLPKKRCSKEFKCQACDFQWIDKQFLSLPQLVILKLQDLKSDTFSQIFEFFRTQNCPKCDSKILKNGGCSHMTCKKCTFYYCWTCNNELPHNEKLCAVRAFVYFELILTQICITLYHLGWLTYIGAIILYPLLGLGIVILCNSYIVLPFTMVLTAYNAIHQKSRMTAIRYQKFLRTQVLSLAVFQLIIALFIGLLPYYDVFPLTWNQFLHYHYCQWMIILIIGSAIIIVAAIHKYVYSNWLKYLI